MQRYKKMHLLKGRIGKILFLAICLNSIYTAAYAQKKVSLPEKNTSIERIFKHIEEQTGYSFAYNRSQFDYKKNVTVNAKNIDVSTLLSQVLKDTGCEHQIRNGKIFLSPAKKPEPAIVTGATAEKSVAEKTAAAEAAAVAEAAAATIEATAKAPQEEDLLIADASPLSMKMLDDEPQPIPPSIPQSNTNHPENLYIHKEKSTPTPYPTPRFALKTNLLYDATLSPSLAAEVKLSSKYTLELAFSVNPWKQNSTKKFNQLLVQPELRYWLCNPFGGHFFGLHGIYANYNISGAGFSDFMKAHRFEGNLYGAGISYGYQWQLAPRWSVEATAGFGYAYLDYDQYECRDCAKKQKSVHKNYLGPTKAGISLIYLIK